VCSLTDVLALRKALAALSSGRIIVSVVKPPYKCPPVVYEYAFVIDHLLRARGVRDACVRRAPAARR
jgi:hypothetical protein